VGHVNDKDASFCESCGANIETTSFRRVIPESPPRKRKEWPNQLILIVVCIILVAGLGITAGALIEMNKVAAVPINNNSSVS